MQKKISYVCDMCGTEFKNEADADKCEKGHVAPKKIKKANYVCCNNDKTGLPKSIVVEMEDGSTVAFKRY